MNNFNHLNPTPPLSPSVVANEWAKLPAFAQHQHRTFTPRPSRPHTPHSSLTSRSPTPSPFASSCASPAPPPHTELELEIEELDDADNDGDDDACAPLHGEFEDAPERSAWSDSSDDEEEDSDMDSDDGDANVCHSFRRLSTSYGYGRNAHMARWMGVPMVRKKRSHAESLDGEPDSCGEETASGVSSSGGRIRRRKIAAPVRRRRSVEEALRRARSEDEEGEGFEMDMEL
ncbi:hypothetical protein EDC01DRAFT_626265 [Geopyxis carbonaria]|nr:hypothetical protein EDC01DRAFT_626265 [Geopyxis carbonaria]